MLIDGKAIGEPVRFDAASKGVLELPGIAGLLTTGEHKLEVRMNEGSEMPYAISIGYNNLKPDSSDDCKLSIDVSLADDVVTEGDVTEARVQVKNNADAIVPMPMAIVGIPGGLEVRHDQLKELVSQGRIDAYEVIGRDVVLYWRSFDNKFESTIPLSLVGGGSWNVYRAGQSSVSVLHR